MRPTMIRRADLISRLPVPLQLALHKGKREMKALVLAGRAVECPVCNSHFRRLQVVGDGNQVLCPRCLSLERHRRAVLFLRRCTNLYSDRLRVLHVAPELGLRRELSRLPNLDYVTADLSDADVSLRMDITAIDFPDETFDVILCSHVLEHVVDDRQAARELRRVLRSDGWALINVPSDPKRTDTYENPTIVSPEQRLVHFGQSDHVRIYSAQAVMNRLREAGFDVEIDPLVFTTAEIERYVLEGDGGWDHAYLCRPSCWTRR